MRPLTASGHNRNLSRSRIQDTAQMIANLGILGAIQAVDSTSIATPFKDDPDAVWSYDATKKEYYFGYGLLLVVDVDTQLPIAARFVQRKQASKEEWAMVIHEGMLVKKPTIFLGDSGLDIIEMQEQLMDDMFSRLSPTIQGTLIVHSTMKYRVEDLVRKRTDKVTFKRKELEKVYIENEVRLKTPTTSSSRWGLRNCV